MKAGYLMRSAKMAMEGKLLQAVDTMMEGVTKPLHSIMRVVESFDPMDMPLTLAGARLAVKIIEKGMAEAMPENAFELADLLTSELAPLVGMEEDVKIDSINVEELVRQLKDL